MLKVDPQCLPSSDEEGCPAAAGQGGDSPLPQRLKIHLILLHAKRNSTTNYY